MFEKFLDGFNIFVVPRAFGHFFFEHLLLEHLQFNGGVDHHKSTS